MTILSPSLPPVISMTTSTVSFPTSADIAVLAINCGTTGAKANKKEVRKARSRNWRRLNMGPPKWPSCQLILRAAHDGMKGVANAFIQLVGWRRAVLDESNQAGSCRIIEFALQEDLGDGRNAFIGCVHFVLV